MYFVKLRVGTGLDTEAPVFWEDLRPVSHFEGLGGTTQPDPVGSQANEF